MTRRLLPYEYQLIKELGISEAEYLEFAKRSLTTRAHLATSLPLPKTGKRSPLFSQLLVFCSKLDQHF
jgi:hypothetical protein